MRHTKMPGTLSNPFILMLCLVAASKPYAVAQIRLESAFLQIALDNRGFVSTIAERKTGINYLAEDVEAPLLSISVDGHVEHPTGLEEDDGEITLHYGKSKISARLLATASDNYITFELTDITRHADIELVIWGPFPTTIKESIGETVGVVHNQAFALGIQALNVKTLGGYPDEENDIEPSYNIFASGYYADMTDEWKNRTAYRGQTARPETYGSVLQAYCRHRNKDRTISNWRYENYMAPAYADGGVVGSKIALFGVAAARVLDIIQDIELTQGLPHPTIDGAWAKTSKAATASYLIINFGEENLDRALDLTTQAGLKYLYHGHPFETWGHFKLNATSFPDNWDSMRRCVERAEAKQIKLGIHTLSNFITTNDPYVTPTPDKRLARVGESVLTQHIDAQSDQIYIESPTFFAELGKSALRAAVINDEIIRYSAISDSEPWQLIGCVRGAFGTMAAEHTKGTVIGKLMDHDYRVFLSNAELSAEIAKNIASLMNYAGLMQISFDGLEGVWSTGKGQYARSLFTSTWYDHLAPDLKGKVINDASNPSHYNWHINTRYNWGEPWYAGFRESQTYYRLMNQQYYRRNFLPAMLGWFTLTDKTSIEDTEWLLARAAGFDAGFAFNVEFNAIAQNGASNQILEAIRNWETLRMAGIFSEEQKSLMQDIGNEFHLAAVGPARWNLYPYFIQRFSYARRVRQPGEPVADTFEFDNPYAEQPAMFTITLEDEGADKGTLVDHISLEINHIHVLEIPVRMTSSQHLKTGSDGVLKIYDSSWNHVETIGVDRSLPKLSKGKNTVQVEARFVGGTSAKISIEMKTIGPGEMLTLGDP